MHYNKAGIFYGLAALCALQRVAQVAASHGSFRDRNSSPSLELHSACMDNCCLRLRLILSPLVGRQHLNRKLSGAFLTLRTREITLANEGASKNNLHA